VAISLLLREAHVGQLRHEPTAATARRHAPKQDVGRLDVAVQLNALVTGGRVQEDEALEHAEARLEPLLPRERRRRLGEAERREPLQPQLRVVLRSGVAGGEGGAKEQPVLERATLHQRVDEARRLRVEAEAEQRQQARVAAGAEQLNFAHELKPRLLLLRRCDSQPLDGNLPGERQRRQRCGVHNAEAALAHASRRREVVGCRP